MRITVREDSPELLDIKLTPTSAPALLGFGLLMIGASVLIAWAMGDCSELNYKNGDLRYRITFLGGFFPQEGTLPGSKVRLDTEVYSNAFSKTRDLTLYSGSDVVRVPLSGLNGDEKQAVAQDFTDAIRDGNDLQYASGTGMAWLGVFLGGLVFCGGLTCLYFLQTSWVVCSRKEDKISVTMSRWLIPGTTVNSIQLTQFKRVVHSEMKVKNADGPSASSNYVRIMTNSNDIVPLASGPMFTDASTEKIKSLIGDWMEQQRSKSSRLPEARDTNAAEESHVSL